MSAYALIGYRNFSNTDLYTCVKVILDGRPFYTGKILNTYYRSPGKIKELISKGTIYQLGRKINPSNDFHSLSNPEKDVTLFTCRDGSLFQKDPSPVILNLYRDRSLDAPILPEPHIINHVYIYNFASNDFTFHTYLNNRPTPATTYFLADYLTEFGMN